MFEFKNNQFVLTRTFGWQPANLEVDAVSGADQLMHCRETSGPDAKNVVNDFYVPNGIVIDLNDEKIKPYFKEGSLWD